MDVGIAYFDTEEDKNVALARAIENQVVVVEEGRAPEDARPQVFAGKYFFTYKPMLTTTNMFEGLAFMNVVLKNVQCLTPPTVTTP